MNKAHLPLRRVIYHEYQRMRHGGTEILIWERHWLHLECGHKTKSPPSQVDRLRVRCDQCDGRVYASHEAMRA